MTNTKAILYFAVLLSLMLVSPGLSGQGGLGDAVAKKVGLYVFPAQGQDAAQTDKDESECYTWAVQQSGVDPLNPPTVEAAPVQTGPDGTVVKSGAKGAAMGAAIGAIAGDAGKGAAIGAVSGGFGGMGRRRMGRQVQQAAGQQAAVNKEAELMNNFKKAFSVCLEGKGYTVK